MIGASLARGSQCTVGVLGSSPAGNDLPLSVAFWEWSRVGMLTLNQGGACREAEPNVEVMEVVLDGVLADVELRPDLTVG